MKAAAGPTTCACLAACAAALLAAACATRSSDAELDALTQQVMRASFREQGIAKLDRIEQDAMQKACSAAQPPSAEVAQQIQDAAQATIRLPTDGRYLGDWREGEKLAQNGRGMTWSDAPGAASGGNCYNCHQLAKAEISYGTIGPSLYRYGRLRGVQDPDAAAALPVLMYTWGKIYNAKATNACSEMPRFGHAGVLTEAQMRDVMALLLDPQSPVNQ
jgi:sulfur-oxidizing protein SoxX